MGYLGTAFRQSGLATFGENGSAFDFLRGPDAAPHQVSEGLLPAIRSNWLSGSSLSKGSGLFEPSRPMQFLEFMQPAGKMTSSIIAGEFDRAKDFVPSDPLFSSQWHNAGTAAVNINITKAWDYFSGAGVKFGIYDDGIDNDHIDLAGSYDASRHVTVNGVFDDPTIYNSGDAHGTSVAGLVAARQGNGQGGVGGSFNGRLTGVDIFGNGGTDYLFGAMNEQDRFDVTNHSWGWVGAFADNRLSSSWSGFFSGLQDAATNGRGGLGTIQMVAAGNDRDNVDNANSSNFTSSRFVNAIAAITNEGQISYYSNPGASLLVSSPSNGGTLGITTTDYTGSVGYSSGDYFSGFGGTSAATPIASGIVGLILEANPDLGYRDVMEILAITARQIGSAEPSGASAALRPWQFNGAANWNNGGMHFSHDYGFGLIDAFAAVKLADSWNLQQTYANELMVQATNATSGFVLDNNATGLSRTVNLTPASGAPLTIEAIEVQINWSTAHSWSGDLLIELVSPTGMKSYLLDRAGGSADLGSWIFTTRAHLGELATGVWTVRITDQAANDTGTVSSISVRAYGSSDVNDNYYYTDEFGALGAGSVARQSLADADGGVDTVNFAALSSGTTVNLNAGQVSYVAGSSFVIAAGSVIENVVGSWSNDTIEGNASGNRILGNDGNDTIDGNGGSDEIIGGKGSDVIDGGLGTDSFYLEAAWSAITWVATEVSVSFSYIDALLELDVDVVSNVEYFFDTLGERLSWADLLGSSPAVAPDAPAITGLAVDSGVVGDGITSDATPTLTITVDATVDSVEVFIGGVSYGAALGGNGSFAFTPASALLDGSYSVTAVATRDGLTSAASSAYSVLVDTTAPVLSALSPADNASTVSSTANIVLTFGEDVVAGSGNIEIRLASDNSVWRTIAVTSPEVSILHSQVTINPGADLPAGTMLYVTIQNGAFTDLAGNLFGGIANPAAYNFMTSAGNIMDGNDNANTLTGTSGNDIMNGYGGTDTISGNGGDDTIDGGADSDTMTGGANTAVGDTVSYLSATSGVSVSLAIIRAQVTGGAGTDTLSGFENLMGSNLNDRLTGSTGANTLNGAGGSDVLTGGTGVDALWGGAGSDTFDFNAATDTGNTSLTRDSIMDFESGLDSIDLSTIDASSSRSGNNAFVFRGEASNFGTSADGEIRFVHESGMTIIYGDTDRDSTPEFQIALNGIHVLTSSDFIL